MPQCKALTNQLFIDVSGFYAPCCMITDRNPKNLIESCSPEEWLISPEMKSIQDNMNGDSWDSKCHICKLAESEGRESFREIYNREYSQPAGTLETFLINTRNICNIRCRMCSPTYSNKWADTLKVIPIDSNLNFMEQYEKIKHLIGPNFKYLKIAGGEPFLDPGVIKVIESVLEKCTKLDLQFNTNLTFFPKKYKSILDKVHTIRPIYSVDGTGLVNDYIRHDSDWETTTDVLHQWTDYIHSRSCSSDEPHFQTTVQAYNFHDQQNIKNLMHSFGITKEINWIKFSINWPFEFRLHALPPEYIKKHTNSANEKFVTNYKFDEKLFFKLKEKTIADDKLLGTTIGNCIPELYELLYK